MFVFVFASCACRPHNVPIGKWILAAGCTLPCIECVESQRTGERVADWTGKYIVVVVVYWLWTWAIVQLCNRAYGLIWWKKNAHNGDSWQFDKISIGIEKISVDNDRHSTCVHTLRAVRRTHTHTHDQMDEAMHRSPIHSLCIGFCNLAAIVRLPAKCNWIESLLESILICVVPNHMVLISSA